jgi:hypothetical protein
MTHPQQSFGATDTFPCPECGGRMRISRRTPHGRLGVSHERQTFTCMQCGHEMLRDADAGGDVERVGADRSSSSDPSD